MAGGDELQRQQSKGLKLFGVRIVGDEAGPTTDDVMRKSASMGNLVSATAVDNARAGENGYLSDGGLHPSSRRRQHERKRGVPWTEEEHRTFLAGLQKLGKGDWRGISRNFVTSRTPTQVASHAQKYFLRQSNINKKKRRSSLFDVVIDGTIPAAETAQKPHSKKTTESTEAFKRHSHDNHLVSDSTVTDQHIPATILDETLGITDYAATCFNTNPPVCIPNFLSLSLQHSHFQTKSTVSSSNVDSSNLELSIAPPQPSKLAKLSSHSLAGVIRVI